MRTMMVLLHVEKSAFNCSVMTGKNSNSNINTLSFFIQIQFNYIAIFEIGFKYVAHVFIIVEVFIVGEILSVT